MKDITRVIAKQGAEVRLKRLPRTINSPLYTGSTVLFDSWEDLAQIQAGEYDGITYGTDRLPNQREFEEALCELEGGYACRAFQSGISAITHTLLAYTRAGDHILVCENVYGPTANFCKKVLARFNVEVSFIPADVGETVSAYLRPNTRLIFLESPGSNTFEIQDIQSVAAVAAEYGIITVIDNTWATPLYLKPFSLGIDVSIQSATKYISGHSDVLLGAVTVNEKWAKELIEYYQVMELFASPQDCYLALRGMKTLAVRMRHHERAALEIAEWLAGHPLVDQVIHPALPSHPQYELWQRYFTGSAGLFSFSFKQDYTEEQIGSFINRLKLFSIGFSWGGFKSLVTVGRYERSTNPELVKRPLVRLNIGLEEVGDLRADLQQAFEVLGQG